MHPDKMNFLITVNKILKKTTKVFRRFLEIMGIILVIAILLSFTNFPYWAYYWLGTHNTEIDKEPNVVVLLGGSGMPSPDGLIRSYYAAQVCKTHENARVIIALPEDTALHEDSPELLLAHELIIRGIDSNRISYERNGVNTYTQALNIALMLSNYHEDSLYIRLVTSPDHMYRSVLTFRKTGFKNVGGMPSFEIAVDKKKLIKKHCKDLTIDQEQQLNMRYNMWSYLKYEITVVREYCAICYYKMRGWI